MRIDLFFVGNSITNNAQLIATDLARKAYPHSDIQTHEYRPNLVNRDDIRVAYLFTQRYLESGTTVLALVDTMTVQAFDVMMDEKTKGNLLTYRSDRQLESDLKKKWHVGESHIFQSGYSDYEDILDENISLRKEREFSKRATVQSSQLQKELELLRKERDDYKTLYETQKNQTLFGNDYRALQDRFDRLQANYDQQSKTLAGTNKRMTELNDQLTEAKQKLSTEHSRGYEDGRESMRKEQEQSTDIYEVLRKYKDTGIRRLPRFLLQGKHDNIHVLFSAGARTEISFYPAVYEDMNDNYQEKKQDTIFVDISNETQIYRVARSRPSGERGALWLENPNYKTIHKHLSTTERPWLMILTPFGDNPYNTNLILQWNWQDILDQLSQTGKEIYLYLGRLFDPQKLILCNSMVNCVKEMRLYLEAWSQAEALYALKGIPNLNRPQAVVLNVYRWNDRFWNDMVDEFKKRNIEIDEIYYDFYAGQRGVKE